MFYVGIYVHLCIKYMLDIRVRGHSLLNFFSTLFEIYTSQFSSATTKTGQAISAFMVYGNRENINYTPRNVQSAVGMYRNGQAVGICNFKTGTHCFFLILFKIYLLKYILLDNLQDDWVSSESSTNLNIPLGLRAFHIAHICVCVYTYMYIYL